MVVDCFEAIWLKGFVNTRTGKPSPCSKFAILLLLFCPLVNEDSSIQHWFFCRTLVAFGLNALYNRQQVSNAWGPWDSSNARALIDFSVKQNIQIDAWELGNQLRYETFLFLTCRCLFDQETLNVEITLSKWLLCL